MIVLKYFFSYLFVALIKPFFIKIYNRGLSIMQKINPRKKLIQLLKPFFLYHHKYCCSPKNWLHRLEQMVICESNIWKINVVELPVYFLQVIYHEFFNMWFGIFINHVYSPNPCYFLLIASFKCINCNVLVTSR